VAADLREQREQFILVNNTKPLPKGLVYELLPATEAKLPSALQKRRFPTALLDRLNLDPDSPLKGMVRTPTRPTGVVKDNSLLKALENSPDGRGPLPVPWRWRRGDRGRARDVGDVEELPGAVATVFPDARKLPPRRSRFLHGAGGVRLGFVMDVITDRHRKMRMPTEKQFRADQEPLRGVSLDRRALGVWPRWRCGSGTRCRIRRRTSRCWRTTRSCGTASGCGSPPGRPAQRSIDREQSPPV
jgi:hypothetical protein